MMITHACYPTAHNSTVLIYVRVIVVSKWVRPRKSGFWKPKSEKREEEVWMPATFFFWGTILSGHLEDECDVMSGQKKKNILEHLNYITRGACKHFHLAAGNVSPCIKNQNLFRYTCFFFVLLPAILLDQKKKKENSVSGALFVSRHVVQV